MDVPGRAARIFNLVVLTLVALFSVGCSAPKGTLFYGALSKGQSVVVIGSGAATGAQAVVAYSTTGTLIEVLADTTYDALIPKGLARLDPFNFIVAYDGASDTLSKIATTGSSSTFVVNSNLSGTLFQMAYHESSKTYFVIEGNTIEAFDSAGNRIGSAANPAINTTVTTGANTCVLNTPRGLAINEATNRLFVTNTGAGTQYVNVYDLTSVSGITCVSRNSTIGNNTPVPIISHSSGYLYTATQLAAATRLYALNSDGSGTATAVYTDASRVVLNNPSAILELPDGSILVANEGTDQIDKFTVSGTGAAVRVGTTPFIKDAFTPFVNDMIVIRGL